MSFNLIAFIQAAIKNGTPLLFGTTGEILTEKTGNMNLGVEGLMYMGGAFGLAGAFLYERSAGDAANGILAVIIAILCAFLAGCLGSLIFSFLTISLKANQNVTGLALTIFGTGVGKFVGEYMKDNFGGDSGTFALSNNLKDVFVGSPFPDAMQNIPVIGPLLFSYSFFVYFGLIISVVMAVVLVKTRLGLNIRAIGESPATADTAGVNVEAYKYLCTIIGGGISGLGGMVYTMTTSGTAWTDNGISGQGWIAVALVIFCLWKPLNSIWGSALFGALMIMYLWVPIPIPAQIYKIVPYIITAIVLVMVSIRQRREDQPPAALGLPYFREER